MKKYYLYVGRLVPYKKVDLLIKTFNKLGKELVIIGAGSQKSDLKSISKPNIKFMDNMDDTELAVYYRNAKALIMPQEEDFGIVSVEAQSLGIPVIAFAQGGALDTVTDGKTGILFNEQTEESLTKAIARFEKTSFVVDNLYANAKKFSKENFRKEIRRLI